MSNFCNNFANVLHFEVFWHSVYLTANKCTYKTVLIVFKTLHVYHVEILCGVSTQCLVGPPSEPDIEQCMHGFLNIVHKGYPNICQTYTMKTCSTQYIYRKTCPSGQYCDL